jgi:hypothetical protein
MYDEGKRDERCGRARPAEEEEPGHWHAEEDRRGQARPAEEETGRRRADEKEDQRRGRARPVE